MRKQALKKKSSKLERRSLVSTKARKGYSLIEVPKDFKQELEVLSESKKVAPLVVLNKALILYKKAEKPTEEKKLSFYERNKNIIERGQFHGSKIPPLPHKKGMENFGR